MFDTGELRDGLAVWVAALQPGVHTGEHARVLLDVMADIKRLAGAAETLLAARVAETDAWRGGPDRSAAHWLARRTGTSIAEARAKLDVAEHLAGLPATSEAFRSGRLSDQQARHEVGPEPPHPTSTSRAAPEQLPLRVLSPRATTRDVDP